VINNGKIAPAYFWRAFLWAGVLCLPAFGAPPSKSNRAPSGFVQLGQPDQGEGAAILREFRSLGIAGAYYLEFELRVRPRRGKEKSFRGQLWGSRNEWGPISRVVLYDAAGAPRRLLIQNGSNPQVTTWQDGQVKAQTTTVEGLLAPLLPETELTAFDLLMPYLFWDDFVFEGTNKILGRAAHTFLLTPPAGLAKDFATLRGVRVQLDTQFHAMVQSTLINAKGDDFKTFTVRDLKKVGDQWMVKTIDLRNELTRDKTRFQVLRAAVNLDLSPRIFTAAALPDKIAAPAKTESLGN